MSEGFKEIALFASGMIFAALTMLADPAPANAWMLFALGTGMISVGLFVHVIRNP